MGSYDLRYAVFIWVKSGDTIESVSKFLPFVPSRLIKSASICVNPSASLRTASAVNYDFQKLLVGQAATLQITVLIGVNPCQS